MLMFFISMSHWNYSIHFDQRTKLTNRTAQQRIGFRIVASAERLALVFHEWKIAFFSAPGFGLIWNADLVPIHVTRKEPPLLPH
ncbi:MAG: hypothetical protein KDA65_11960 [Planctomycetaceae bacterium]|nr:hypothetical protein [Planctomycetaceae bacterium]